VNRDQLFFVLTLIFLSVIALPGVSMRYETSRRTATVSEEEQELTPAQMDQLPETEINLTGASESERRRIELDWKIDVNAASFEELQELPQVGPATAKSILEYREAGNQFRTIDDLEEISGIGPTTIENIRPEATVGPDAIAADLPEEEAGPGIDINEAGIEELQELPRVGEVTAEAIITYREQQGGIGSLEELKRIDGLGPATIQQLEDYVRLDETAAAAEPAATEPELIDINSASQQELTKLPRVGPVRAAEIIEYREERGGFDSLEDLKNISGIGPVTLEEIREMAVVH